MQRSNADVVEEQLATGAARLGLTLEPVARERLVMLLGAWSRFGRALNLSGAIDQASLLKHVLEGMQVVALAQKIGWHPGQAWLDVGSGAGFPGLVVAACLDVVVTLVEPRKRRAAFLDLAVHQIGRGDCRVVRGHVEGSRWRPISAGERLEPGFDWTSARAVFTPEMWVEVGQHWVHPGGVVVAHVGVETPPMPLPDRMREVARVDGERWSIRGIGLS